MSHDLRSPLSRIRLAAELLPQRSEPQPQIEAITRHIDHADALTGSFLDFVRAGSLAMDETVDVAALACAVLARFDCPSELLQALARGDPGRSRPGSGLGLSVVRQAVARIGGTLAFVRDETGHHATARFERASAPVPTS